MRKRRKGLFITDFDICLGWEIGGPLSKWLFNVFCGPTPSEILRLIKRGQFSSMMASITILGFLMEIKLKSFHNENE
jgi:Na+/H+ antiporter NhaC